MKTKCIPFILLMIGMVSACQTTTPPPNVAAHVNTEFTLAPGQSATVADKDLTISFHSVPGDARCPSEVECAASGPVSISLSVQQGNEAPTDVALQTFTDHTGRAPSVPFEGITNRVEAAEYLIQIVGVTPYPQNPEIKIEPSEYRVALLVSKP
jgi:hypothetical protein